MVHSAQHFKSFLFLFGYRMTFDDFFISIHPLFGWNHEDRQIIIQINNEGKTDRRKGYLKYPEFIMLNISSFSLLAPFLSILLLLSLWNYTIDYLIQVFLCEVLVLCVHLPFFIISFLVFLFFLLPDSFFHVKARSLLLRFFVTLFKAGVEILDAFYFSVPKLAHCLVFVSNLPG